MEAWYREVPLLSSADPKICFALSPAYGHVYPVMPLAEATHRLAPRSDIAVAAPFLGDLPVPTVPGMDLDPTSTDLKEWTLEHFPTVQDDMPARWVPAFFGVANALPAVPALRAAWQSDRPDLVVHDPANPAAAVVADELGIPAITFGVFHYFPPMLDLPRVTRRALDDPNVEPWQPFGDSAPVKPYIDPVPAALQVGPVTTHRADVLPIRTTAWDDPALTFTPANARHPLVYVSFGTVVADIVGLRSVVLEAAGVAEVLVTTGPSIPPTALGELPPNVTAVALAPAASVMAAADLVIHHGGLGTTLAATQCGVPQVVVPHIGDQFANAQAVQRAGVGVVASAAADVTRSAVEALMHDAGVTSAAHVLAEDIAGLPSPDQVAATLVELAGGVA